MFLRFHCSTIFLRTARWCNRHGMDNDAMSCKMVWLGVAATAPNSVIIFVAIIRDLRVGKLWSGKGATLSYISPHAFLPRRELAVFTFLKGFARIFRLAFFHAADDSTALPWNLRVPHGIDRAMAVVRALLNSARLHTAYWTSTYRVIAFNYPPEWNYRTAIRRRQRSYRPINC